MAPRSQLETRVGALPWAAIPYPEKGEGFQLPACQWRLGERPRVKLVSEVCGKDGQDRGREKSRDRQEDSEQASAKGKWEGLTWGSWLSC